MKRTKTVIILLAATALIIIGLFNNQFAAVLTKASKVCLECVGIG